MNRTNSESDYRINLLVSFAPKLHYSFESDMLFRITSVQKVPVILDLLTQSSGQDYVCLKITNRYLKLIVQEVLCGLNIQNEGTVSGLLSCI